MSVSSHASFDAAARTLVLRHVRSLIAKTLAFFAQHQDQHLKTLRAHFFEQVDARPHTTQAQNLRTAGVMLDKKADLFNRSFQAALREVIEEEFDQVFPGALAALRPEAEAADSGGPMSMALLDVDEIERHLLVDRVAQRFNQHYEARIGPLTQSLAVLLRQPDLSLADNPFRPATLIRAFGVAWHMSDFDPAAAEDFISALEPRHGIDWTPLYTDLTATLVRAGFTAQAVHRIKRAAGADSGHMPLSSGHEAARSGFAPIEQERQASPAGEPTRVDAARGIAARARQFLQMLGFGLPAAGPAGAEGAGPGGGGGRTGDGAAGDGATTHAPADPELMGFLGGLQAGARSAPAPAWVEGQALGDQNLLRQMRDRDEVRRAPELDRGTIDALAEVFDYVFADRSIPMQLKIVIGRLQIPVLKAAMIDRDFFLTSDHPARRLVDALASASVAWMPEKGEQDPLYLAIEGTVKRVLAEFEDDLGLFGSLLAEFNAFLAEGEQQAQGRIAPTANQEQGSEALEMARSHADEVVHQCISALPQGETLAPFLLPFLANQWREVLARAWAGRDQSPAAWDQAVTTMDSLIWSTQPKTTGEDRTRLMTVLPDLVGRLNAGLDAIGWEGEVRAAFTKRLIAVHMKAIRTARSGPAPLESGSGELEAAAGRSALQALDARRAQHVVVVENDDFDALAQGFTRGLWFDFTDEQGNRRRYRLSWVSPQRTRLLFTNREGFEAFVRSEHEVAEMLRAGRLAVLDDQPIVARAIGQIMTAAGSGELDMELA